MLIDFSVENFLSIKDPLTFSMITGNNDDKSINIIAANRELNLLPVATIYGFNASGKSNLIKAMEQLKKMIVYSKVPDPDLLDFSIFEYKPYKLDDKIAGEPTSFRIRVSIDDIIYVYEIEYDYYEIIFEELSVLFEDEDRLRTVYTRNNDELECYFDVDVNLAKKVAGSNLSKKLLIGALSLFDTTIERLVNWVEDDLNIISSNFNSHDNLDKTIKYLLEKDGEFHDKLISMLNDIAYSNISTIEANLVDESIKNDDLSDDIKKLIKKQEAIKMARAGEKEDMDLSNYTLNTYKSGLDSEGNKRLVAFNLNEESEGTLKIYALYSYIYDALNFGKTLVIDEMTSFIHPLISRYILSLFQNSRQNKNGQLISTTHTTDLLEIDSLRKEQVYLTDKKFNSTKLYSLSDIKEVSDEENFRMAYLAGKYGGLNYFRRELYE